MEIILKSGEKSNIDQQLIDDFGAKLGGAVITPADTNYNEVRQIWNGMHDKKPALIAQCSGVADVMASVNFARASDILFSVRGGGHNVGGSASNDGGLMIDLSQMKGIRLNTEKGTVHAQGGATLADLDRETQVLNMAVPAGVVSTTGIAGLTLGGGLGWLRKKYGLSIDNLVSVDVVTADGNFLTACEKEYSDLFWAVRGGGGNFGIVTSFEYRMYPVGPMVTLAAPFYPAEEAKKILPVWREFIESSPDEISGSAMFWTIPPAPDFPEETHGRRVLILATVHCGEVDEGEKLLQPLREISTPLVDLSTPIPWTMLQGMFDPFFPKAAQHYYFKSTYLKELNDETVDALFDQAVNPPQPMILIAIWHYGGAMSRIKDTATAFTGRKNKYLFSIDACWADASADDEVLAYARGFLKHMQKSSPGGLYVNFAGLGEEGVDLVKSAYGKNYERLSVIKKKYDPGNLFRINQNIKPVE
ncbi:FAD-binding oxidoreductase [Draconibacterium halophilum]|uniref:FAD-binding oxidoreductase n=1 Tax=Draconibacterium halophilum TaxID=2706887 RepID=A0A6C0RC69_9BACT|nr:FAD-binding oxidoreductase [Draconibacterium halophilum]QIA07616.1 FAD-binding oxidoreductase [Draconibacterium halophilum]